MKEIKIFELFAGIGAPRKALDNLKIPYESLGYSEIDKHAINSYCAIHNDKMQNNYGDISKIKELPKGIDLLFHGSPCQDFSLAGLSKGGEEGSGTRSSLMFETIRLAKKSLPKIIVWENVLSVINKTHIETFNKYLDYLEKLGYNNSYDILNSKDFKIPQNRRRVFVVSIYKEKRFCFNNLEKQKMEDISNYIDFNKECYSLYDLETKFGVNFKETRSKTKKIGYFPSKNNKDYLDKRVYYLDEYAQCLVTSNNCMYKLENFNKLQLSNKMKKYIVERNSKTKIINPNPIRTITTREGQVRICTSSYISKQFLQNENVSGVDLQNKDVRKLSPCECFLLMGFTKDDYVKSKKVCSNAQLYKQAGNSIVVTVLEAIFKELFKKETSNEYQIKLF